jgi:hypothetical protein
MSPVGGASPRLNPLCLESGIGSNLRSLRMAFRARSETQVEDPEACFRDVLPKPAMRPLRSEKANANPGLPFASLVEEGDMKGTSQAHTLCVTALRSHNGIREGRIEL